MESGKFEVSAHTDISLAAGVLVDVITGFLSVDVVDTVDVNIGDALVRVT